MVQQQAATVSGSPYAITPTSVVGTGLANYTLVYHAGTMIVTPKTLNITANSMNKQFGTTLVFTGSEFTVGAGDLVNGNSVSGVSLTSAGAAASATAGTYPIVASAATGSGLTNYTIHYIDGILTVTGKLNPNVSVTGGSFTYTATAHAATGFAYGSGGISDILTPAVTFSYVGTGGTVYGPTAAAPINAGNYTVTASFAGNSSYNPATNTAIIVIQKANVSGSFTAANKVYDGNTSATVLTRSLNGVLAADLNNVSLTGGTATFATATIGNNKTVTLDWSHIEWYCSWKLLINRCCNNNSKYYSCNCVCHR